MFASRSSSLSVKSSQNESEDEINKHESKRTMIQDAQTMIIVANERRDDRLRRNVPRL
jgi:hypothetical protein